MDYIMNENQRKIAEVSVSKVKKNTSQPVLSKANVSAYSKALRRIGIKGGSR